MALCLGCCLLGLPIWGLSQGKSSEKYFIYIQNEGGKPFYVRSQDTLLSSSPTGYLIIPQLARGTYRVTIGFPRNEAPESSFQIDLTGADDRGYLLKKGAEGLVLYGLRDFKVLKPAAVASAPGNRIVNLPPAEKAPSPKAKTALAMTAPEAETKPEKTIPPPAQPAADDTDAFSKLLNEITGTSETPETPVSKPATTASPDTIALAETEKPGASSQPGAVIQPEPPSESQTPDSGALPGDPGALSGFGLSGEPVHPEPKLEPKKHAPEFITFPADSATPVTAPAVQTDLGEAVLETTQEGELVDTAAEARRWERKLKRAKRRASKEAARALEEAAGDTSQVQEETVPSAVPTEQQTALAVAPEVLQPGQEEDAGKRPLNANSDCKGLESADDFQKVRRKMASRSDEEGMFKIAKKYLAGSDCFSVEQIQSLTYLFMTDDYKYKFLELVYPHTYDPGHFSRLMKTLGTSYYQTRFKAIIR